MPRGPRAIHAGVCYHLINRGNNRRVLFHRPAEYAAFLTLVREAQDLHPLELFAACLMPNHFHLVVRPAAREDIGRWMHRVLTSHAHRFNRVHETVGRVWQGRYKAFPIESGEHLLTVIRYVERNALRAGLVRRARDWRWGSAAWRRGPSSRSALLTRPPVELPQTWEDWLDAPQTPGELEALRTCVNRQQPYGSENWTRHAPECDGFWTPRPAGRRPRIRG